MQSVYKEAIKELAKECRSVEDIQDKLRELFKEILQQVFEAEMDDHLGYSKHDNAGDNTANSIIVSFFQIKNL